MRLLTFDHLAAGHHATWSADVVATGRALGHEVTAVVDRAVVAPIRARVGVDDPLRLVPFDGRAGRDPRLARPLRRWLVEHGAWDADLQIDLFADQLAWCWPTPRTDDPRQVHVLHQVFATAVGSRTAKGYAAVPLWSVRLRQLTRHGSSFVVFGEAARRHLARLGAGRRVHVVPMPGVGGPMPAERPDPEPRTLLAVGDRPMKRLDLTVAALLRTPGWDRLDVMAEPSAELTELLAPLGARARVIAPVQDAAFNDELRRHALVLCPYADWFRHRMSPSGIVTDALRLGVPLVASDYLLEYVPAAYPGAVACRPDDPTSLADAVTDALSRIDELADAAWRVGAPWAATELSFERFVTDVVAIGSA